MSTDEINGLVKEILNISPKAKEGLQFLVRNARVRTDAEKYEIIAASRDELGSERGHHEKTDLRYFAVLAYPWPSLALTLPSNSAARPSFMRARRFASSSGLPRAAVTTPILGRSHATSVAIFPATLDGGGEHGWGRQRDRRQLHLQQG